jgi:hypothetical protein
MIGGRHDNKGPGPTDTRRYRVDAIGGHDGKLA